MINTITLVMSFSAAPHKVGLDFSMVKLDHISSQFDMKKTS